jgi:hypothetical protein
MSSVFPIQINSLNFYINPTQLSISKPTTFATLPTANGFVYQFWYDSPEVLTLTGASAGTTAYNELVFLKNNFQLTNKVVSIFYKTKLYQGFITNLTVEHSTSHINRFNYTLAIQLLQGQQFAIEDMSITQNNQGFIEGGINSAVNLINQKLGLSSVQSSLNNLTSKI